MKKSFSFSIIRLLFTYIFLSIFLCPIQPSHSTPITVISPSKYLKIKFQRQQKTSSNSQKRATMMVLFSIVLSQTLWYRVVIRRAQEEAGKVFTEKNLRTNFIQNSAIKKDFSQWLTQDQIPMGANFSSSMPKKPHGSMANTASLDRSSLVWKLSIQLHSFPLTMVISHLRK